MRGVGDRAGVVRGIGRRAPRRASASASWTSPSPERAVRQLGRARRGSFLSASFAVVVCTAASAALSSSRARVTMPGWSSASPSVPVGPVPVDALRDDADRLAVGERQDPAQLLRLVARAGRSRRARRASAGEEGQELSACSMVGSGDGVSGRVAGSMPRGPRNCYTPPAVQVTARTVERATHGGCSLPVRPCQYPNSAFASAREARHLGSVPELRGDPIPGTLVPELRLALVAGFVVGQRRKSQSTICPGALQAYRECMQCLDRALRIASVVERDRRACFQASLSGRRASAAR